MKSRVTVDLEAAMGVTTMAQTDLVELAAARPMDVVEAAWDMVEVGPDRLSATGRRVWAAVDVLEEREAEHGVDGWVRAFTLVSALGAKCGLSPSDVLRLALVAAQRVADQ